MSKKQWYRMKAGDNGLDIYLMGDIGGWGITAEAFVNDLNRFDSDAPVNIKVHSDGGDFFDGLAMYHSLKSRSGAVNAEVVGLAASAATLPLMAADHVSMPENTFLMIHKPMTFRRGNSSEMESTLDILKMLDSSVEGIYATKTGKTTEEIAAMLPETSNPGLWLTAKAAVDAGFANEVTAPVEGVSMSTDSLTRLTLVPAQFITQTAKTVDDCEIDGIESISDLEAFLRDAGGFSRKLATAVVSKAKGIVQSDSDRQKAEQESEIISLFKNSFNHKGL